MQEPYSWIIQCLGDFLNHDSPKPLTMDFHVGMKTLVITFDRKNFVKLFGDKFKKNEVYMGRSCDLFVLERNMIQKNGIKVCIKVYINRYDVENETINCDLT